MGTTLFEELGGEAELRGIIDEFVDRVFDDAMIGFLFRRANKARIKAFEYQLAAELLGSGETYRGRPLAEAHRPHRIMGGQFDRRREILRQVLVARGAPAQVIEAWLAHTDSLRPLITPDEGGACTDGPAPGHGRQ
jgi:hemoglobin